MSRGRDKNVGTSYRDKVLSRTFSNSIRFPIFCFICQYYRKVPPTKTWIWWLLLRHAIPYNFWYPNSVPGYFWDIASLSGVRKKCMSKFSVAISFWVYRKDSKTARDVFVLLTFLLQTHFRIQNNYIGISFIIDNLF